MKVRNAVVAVAMFLVLAISAMSASASPAGRGGQDIVVFDIVDSFAIAP